MENLVSILNDQTIYAYNHHCLFSPKLKNEDKNIQKRFKVVCFTETPLDKIHLLTNISGRQVDLEPYGLVFRKNKIREARGNPVVYIYDENNRMIKFLHQQYDEYIRTYDNEDGSGDFNTLGSIVNIVKDGHDFHWEREWRVRQKLKFDSSEVFAVIAPSNVHTKIRKAIDTDEIRYIPFIDPRWNYEEMVDEMACYMWSELRKE
ncbi:hypothetical protein J1TS5_04010 [Paenibacillus macerans]|uniref:hypothetical protein n=1 Tax=Paenibacillus macerans TaxID=44252 RepID=UPI001B268865|nr:hypothetical protein [Paenibacillus macerans]GIP08231.1 hypothetical protein J1TS5_04010 [Paenibacillus macerans]